MTFFEADYYDGSSTRAAAIHVTVDDQGYLSSAGLFADLHISKITIAPRLANTPRKIYLADSGYLECADNDTIDQLCRAWPEKNPEGILHRFEKSGRLVLVSVIALVAIILATYFYGIPAASHFVVERLPFSLDQQLGEGVLPELDDTFFRESELSEEEKAGLDQVFERSLAAAAETFPEVGEREYQLLVRSSPVLGANAFALPDGTIIMTDELVALVDNPELLGGIFLHEIAHVVERHSMQNLVRQAGISAMILLISGDASLASSLVLLLPTVLIEAGYSREFENEADIFALQVMQDNGIPLENFTVAMEALVHGHGDHSHESDDSDSASVLDYFSTHPPTEERLQRFRQATPNR